MSKNITGAEHPLAKIFSSDFDYVIPSYQRPYSWEPKQAGELFSDLHGFHVNEPAGSDYFLGSIVLIKQDGKPTAEVIDGQQRLTTLTILLAALTHLATGQTRESMKTFLVEPGNVLQGLSPKPRLSLRERDREFFSRYVQSVKLDELLDLNADQLDNESQKNIQKITKLFLDKLQDTYQGDQAALLKFGAFLIQRCFIVTVCTHSQQSAFRVFSVLNTRGMPLLHTDVLKSEIIGRIDSQQRQKFTDLWEQLEVEAEREGFEEAFGHIRMIYAKEKARHLLTKEFRERVINVVPSAEVLVRDVISRYVNAFLVAKNTQYTSTSNAKEVNALLGWLNRIDNSDWLPCAMRFLVDRGHDAQQTLGFMRNLERLAAFMLICEFDVNERVTRYSRVLADLENPNLSLQPSIDLTDQERSTFLKQLDGDVYSMAPRRRNYILLRLDSFLADGAASYDHSLLTVEHVLPQTVTESSEWATWWPALEDRSRWVHRIANLVPLNRRRNSQAQNHDFSKKKSAYFSGTSGVSSYVLTTQVLSQSEWTPELVSTRQKILLGVFAKSWKLE